jgi:hypothetical protein
VRVVGECCCARVLGEVRERGHGWGGVTVTLLRLSARCAREHTWLRLRAAHPPLCPLPRQTL